MTAVKKRRSMERLFFLPESVLLRGWIGRSGRRGARRRAGLKLPARLLSAFLQLFLQLLLGFLALLRIGPRAVIGLCELGPLQPPRQRRAGSGEPLPHQTLAL